MNECLQRRMVAALNRLDPSSRLHTSLHQRVLLHKSVQSRRNASSSSSSASSAKTKPPPKHTVLEKPDTFRPPSHGSKLRSQARSTTASYGSYGSGNYSYAGGYNQGTSEQEKEDQQKRRYPNMFPNEGTLMYKFLTNKAIHIWISLGTLTLLASITLTQSFLKTSPFAHLMPPLTDLVFHPLRFVRESASAIRLHIDYTSEQTAEKRRQNILDAQKRRLYRRAHGMEDLSREEAEGIDVKGLVDWDDGLTDPQRRKKAETMAREKRERGEVDVVGVEALGPDQGQVQTQDHDQQPPRRKVKRWLGIWE